MIKSNLSVLMGQKKIRSFRALEEATGINRLLLQKIYDDAWERLEKWQLDTLCKFFECSPGDLLVYHPE